MEASEISDPKHAVSAEQVVAERLDDWRQMYQALHTRFETGNFQAGLELVAEIGTAAEAAGHHPDVTLTYPAVEIKLVSHDVGAITSRDIDLARAISEIAARRGVTANPTAIARVEIALDTPDDGAIGPFWAAVLGYDARSDELTDPTGMGPTMWFQRRAEGDGTGQRFHLDIAVPHDLAAERIDAAVAAGGVITYDRSPAFVVLRDRDGNHACICTSLGRQDPPVE